MVFNFIAGLTANHVVENKLEILKKPFSLFHQAAHTIYDLETVLAADDNVVDRPSAVGDSSSSSADALDGGGARLNL